MADDGEAYARAFSPRLGRWVVATGGAPSATRGCLLFDSPPRQGRRKRSTFAEIYFMPGTYSQMLLHVIFSTKQRKPWITEEVRRRLYSYVGGIIREEKGVLYEIVGVEDHVHLYLRWRPDETVSNLMRAVKGRSSKWIHESFPPLEAFAWQEGYSVFSVSKSQEQACQGVHRKSGDASSKGGLPGGAFAIPARPRSGV